MGGERTLIGADLFDLPEFGPVPGDGDLTFMVNCRNSRNGSPKRHDFTIHRDWSVTTPHDLETERFGVALGGFLTCLNLVDHDVPTVCRIVQRRWRRDAPQIKPAASQWAIIEAECRSGCRPTWPLPNQAATHARETSHILYGRTTTSARIKPLLTKVVGAHGEGMLRPPPYRRELVSDPRGMDLLWDCGIHPDVVEFIHDSVWQGGEPLSVKFYLGVVGNRLDLDWLADALSARRDAGTATWLAWHATDRDANEPKLRREWLVLGISREHIDALTRGGYTPDDVNEYATRASRPVSGAAAILTGWVKARCRVAIDDLVRLKELGVSDFYHPSSSTLDSLEVMARALPHAYTRVEIALLLGLAGNAPTTAKLMAQGIRELEFASRRLQLLM